MFRKLSIDKFEALLLAIAAIVAFAVIAFCTTPVFSADTVVPTTPAVVTTATPLIRPASRTLHLLYVPAVKKGWLWSPVPLTRDDMLVLSGVYAGSDKHLSTNDIRRIERVLRLLSAGAGQSDADLQTLLYYITFKSDEPHPLRGVLEQKDMLRFTELDADSKEGQAFITKMQATADRYGIE